MVIKKDRVPVKKYNVIKVPFFSRKILLKYDSDECCICLEKMKGGDYVLLFDNCGHCFHKDCIVQWILKGKNTCPLCKSEIY